MKGKLFVFSAPSGAGKTTITRELLKKVNNIKYSISYTTRKIRDGEKDGIDYHFVDHARFEEMINSGVFIEWAKVYGEYYGTSKYSIMDMVDKGFDVLLDIDIQGAKKIKGKVHDAVFIFILPPSIDILFERLEKRGTESDEVMKIRKNQAYNEIKHCSWFDYIIINDIKDNAVMDAQSIILADRCRCDRQLDRVKRFFPDSI